MAEYTGVNGAPFRESQYILRVLGSFATILMPYWKGEAVARTIAQKECGIEIRQESETVCFDQRSYRFSDNRWTIVAAFDAEPVAFSGIAIAGGPTEVVLSGREARISMSGEAGTRVIGLPGPGQALTDRHGLARGPQF